MLSPLSPPGTPLQKVRGELGCTAVGVFPEIDWVMSRKCPIFCLLRADPHSGHSLQGRGCVVLMGGLTERSLCAGRPGSAWGRRGFPPRRSPVESIVPQPHLADGETEAASLAQGRRVGFTPQQGCGSHAEAADVTSWLQSTQACVVAWVPLMCFP